MDTVKNAKLLSALEGNWQAAWKGITPTSLWQKGSPMLNEETLFAASLQRNGTMQTSGPTAVVR
jgi:hypothetical protein